MGGKLGLDCLASAFEAWFWYGEPACSTPRRVIFERWADLANAYSSSDREEQQFPDGPYMMNQARGHGRAADRIATGCLSSLASLGFFQFEPQTFMRAAEVVPGAPPLKMSFEFGGELSGGPRAPGKGRQPLAQG